MYEKRLKHLAVGNLNLSRSLQTLVFLLTLATTGVAGCLRLMEARLPSVAYAQLASEWHLFALLPRHVGTQGWRWPRGFGTNLRTKRWQLHQSLQGKCRRCSRDPIRWTVFLSAAPSRACPGREDLDLGIPGEGYPSTRPLGTACTKHKRHRLYSSRLQRTASAEARAHRRIVP